MGDRIQFNRTNPPYIIPLPENNLGNDPCSPECESRDEDVRSRRKKKSKSLKSMLLQSDFSLIESYINTDYYLRLSPFRVAGKGKGLGITFASNWFSKFLFIVLNGCALFHDICQLRLLIMSYEIYKDHQKLVYVFLGYRTTLAYMQFRYFQLLWWKRYKFTNIARAMSNPSSVPFPTILSNLSENAKVSYKIKSLPILISTSSLLFAILCAILGFNQLSEAKDWSLPAVLERYRNDLIICLFTSTVHKNGTISLTRLTEFLSTNQVASTTLGVVGASIDVATELIHFCTFDMFLIATITIWLCAKDLQLEQTSFSQRRPSCTDDCDYFRIRQQRAKKLLIQHNQLSAISREVNQMVKLFLPPLTTATVIMITYIIHLGLQRKWFTAFYVGIKLLKPCVAYWLAVKVTDRIDEWKGWFLTEETQRKLQLDYSTIQVKVTEMTVIPIGVGTGAFFVDTRFISSLLGIISTYFFLIREGFNFGD